MLLKISELKEYKLVSAGLPVRKGVGAVPGLVDKVGGEVEGHSHSMPAVFM